MKKWYVITGILALFLVIGVGTCSSNSAKMDRLQGELREAESELVSVRAELEKVGSELAQLQATKEIAFGNGLRVLDVEVDGWGVHGKVENVSDAPMKEVKVLVAYYDEDGSLCGVGQDTVEDLFPREVLEWRMRVFYGWSGLFDVYAIGNRI